MLVITTQTGSLPAGQMRWAARRHDDDRPDASSGTSAAGLFEAVFAALHDGEQVALGFDCPLTLPVSPGGGATAGPDALLVLAAPSADLPGIAELGRLLTELGTWRPWTTVSTSLWRWKANTSVLVWQAVWQPVPADGSRPVAPAAAADAFFRRIQPPAREQEADQPAGPVVNLAAAAARRAGLFVDEAELARPALSITVAGS